MIEAQTEDAGGEYQEVADEDDDGPDLMRVRLEPEQARAFVGGPSGWWPAGRPTARTAGSRWIPPVTSAPAPNGLLN